MQALINLNNKTNTMILGYILMLSLKIYCINIEVKKIDSSTFKTFKIVLTSFQLKNKLIQA